MPPRPRSKQKSWFESIQHCVKSADCTSLERQTTLHGNTDSSTLYLVTDLDKRRQCRETYLSCSPHPDCATISPGSLTSPQYVWSNLSCSHSQFYHNSLRVLHSPVDNCILQRVRVILSLADSLVHAQKNGGLQPLQHTNVCLNVLRSKCLYVKIFTADLENGVSKLLPNHTRLLEMMKKEYLLINFF